MSVSPLPNVAALLAKATPWPWYATVNDLIGGTMVANVDLPAHAIDTRNRAENTHRVVADMVCRDEDSVLVASAPALAAALSEAADALRRQPQGDNMSESLFSLKQKGGSKTLLTTDYIDVLRHAAMGLAPRFAPLEAFDSRLGIIATIEEAEVPVTKPVWTDV